jgi:hypothetical protein
MAKVERAPPVVLDWAGALEVLEGGAVLVTPKAESDVGLPLQ